MIAAILYKDGSFLFVASSEEFSPNNIYFRYQLQLRI